MYGECHNMKVRNNKLNIARQVGRLGDYGVVDWEIAFGDLIEEGRGIKSSPKEELDNSMKKKDVKTRECWEPCATLSQS